MSSPAPDPAAEHGDLQRQGDTDANADAQVAQRLMRDEQRVPNPSAAQRCHTDALHCAFAFLGFKELLPALHSCRDWYAAAAKEPPRDLAIVIRSAAALGCLVASPLRRHVTELRTDASLMGATRLRQLRTLPRLTALNCWLDCADLKHAMGGAGSTCDQRAQPLRDALPPQLRHFAIEISDLRGSHGRTQVMQALLDALPTLAQLTDLRLRRFDESLDLLSLVQLPLLRRLELDLQLTIQQCGVLKQISSLVYLEGINLFNGAAALQALTPPHRLQRIERINLDGRTITPHLMTLLQKLPALTALEPHSLHPDCWSDLRGLTQLRKLKLAWSQSFAAARVAGLGESLSALPHLSDLDLSLPSDRYSFNPPLHLRLPALRRFRPSGVRLPSLSFLQHSPLLEELHLQSCWEMRGDDVADSLRAHPPLRLRLLKLASYVRLSREQRAILRPPSALLPALRSIEYH